MLNGSKIKRNPARQRGHMQVYILFSAFLLGSFTYLLAGDSLFPLKSMSDAVSFKKAFIPGCVLALLLVQLSAFSQIGAAFVVAIDFMFGYAAAVFMATIIPFTDIGYLFILRLFAVMFVAVFLTLAVSNTAILSSSALFMRTKRDKVFPTQLLKLLIIAGIFIVVITVGAPDLI